MSKKVYERDDLKGCLVRVSCEFRRNLLASRPVIDDGYNVGVVVDFKNCQVWVTDRFRGTGTWGEFQGGEDFCSLAELGGQDEGLRVARLVDEFLGRIADAQRDVTAAEKALIRDALLGVVDDLDDYPGAHEQRRARSVALAKLEAATAE